MMLKLPDLVLGCPPLQRKPCRSLTSSVSGDPSTGEASLLATRAVALLQGYSHGLARSAARDSVREFSIVSPEFREEPLARQELGDFAVRSVLKVRTAEPSNARRTPTSLAKSRLRWANSPDCRRNPSRVVHMQTLAG